MRIFPRVGIVGSEASKFDARTAELARREIHDFLLHVGAETVISGACHLGGIDIWAIEEAQRLGLETIEHAPRIRSWSAPGGFRDRNLAIARGSDIVLCVTVRTLPPSYRGMRFDGCYHCLDRTPPHVKSGGCWTAWRCAHRAWRIIE